MSSIDDFGQFVGQLIAALMADGVFSYAEAYDAVRDDLTDRFPWLAEVMPEEAPAFPAFSN